MGTFRDSETVTDRQAGRDGELRCSMTRLRYNGAWADTPAPPPPPDCHSQTTRQKAEESRGVKEVGGLI